MNEDEKTAILEKSIAIKKEVHKANAEYSLSLLERGEEVKSGYIVVLSKSTINNSKSQWDKKVMFVLKHQNRKAPIPVLAGHIKGFENNMEERYPNEEKRPDFWNEEKINPELPFEVRNGALILA